MSEERQPIDSDPAEGISIWWNGEVFRPGERVTIPWDDVGLGRETEAKILAMRAERERELNSPAARVAKLRARHPEGTGETGEDFRWLLDEREMLLDRLEAANREIGRMQMGDEKR